MKSILIADGNESVADLFGYVFACHDWAVTRYSNSQRAQDALRGSAHYDAVLVGYRFDDIDGVELIKQIRALDHRKDVAIVMVTGTVELDIMAAALTAGADDVLYKPVDPDIVVDTVSKCVEGRRHQATLRPPSPPPGAPPATLECGARPLSESELPEIRARRCASCRSQRVVPIGRGIIIAGVIKEKHWCEACGTVFWFIRPPLT
jgi:DNA-binding response OmpR family regulator